MNPVLLKPGSERRSQLVVLGQAVAEADAAGYRGDVQRLRQVALAALPGWRPASTWSSARARAARPRSTCGDTDIANMGLARAAGLPVIVVGDIDRGGVFAGLVGTLALLPPADQALVAGFVVNKFRGAPELLDSGLPCSAAHRPSGVRRAALRDGLGLDAEDSLDLDLLLAPRSVRRQEIFSGCSGGQAAPDQQLHRHRRAGRRAGVVVRFITGPAELADADLVVLPGTRSTVADLAWLRERGLAGAIAERPGPGGRCSASAAGTRCWPSRSTTRWNRARAWSPGLGLLPARVASGQPSCWAARGRALGAPVAGYEIHHGVAEVTDPAAEPFLDGCRRGAVWGTSWHGILENDEFRRAFLAEVAALAGRDFAPAPGTDFAAVRQARLDVLGDLVAEHLDVAALSRLITGGPPQDAVFAGHIGPGSIGLAHAR